MDLTGVSDGYEISSTSLKKTFITTEVRATGSSASWDQGYDGGFEECSQEAVF